MNKTWSDVLAQEKKSENFNSVMKFVAQERAQGKTIYPPQSQVFQAFTSTPFENVRVVLLGQDPYHGPGQAQGLAFSVPKGIPLPPSLLNIAKELRDDVGISYPPMHGQLKHWTDQGVLLLNSVLTVESGMPGSHANRGWEIFTDNVIKILSTEKSGLIFLLWGNYAKKKSVLIDESKHTILTAAHPSPLSAHNGFFGCKHFSKTNELLRLQGLPEIDWNII